MKNFLALALLALAATSSFAACYETDRANSEKYDLPQMICVNSHNLELVVPELPAQPYYKLTVESDLGVVTNEKAKFKNVNGLFQTAALKYFRSQGSSCTRTHHTFVEFKVSVQEDMSPVAFEVTGYDITNPDSCHSKDRVTKIEYSMI